MLNNENCHIPERGDLRSKETVSKSLRVDTIKLEKWNWKTDQVISKNNNERCERIVFTTL